ncbi:SBBP repeat-containing protein [Hyalangium versicolor]|uniref:SBBP repeat-containing protein n=1 Tax=Hyalangium versicolor TaxID=2861190 RepID=UPI001CCE3CB3|nr:SBBP repeat-containing protein [Hyalangium versicolor]
MRPHSLILPLLLLCSLTGCPSEDPKPPQGPGPVCQDLEGRTVCQCNPHWAGYDCDHCASGWTGDSCEQDINECETGQRVCGENATCTNLPGASACTCNPGFTGDGQICALWQHQEAVGSGLALAMSLGTDGHLYIAGSGARQVPFVFLSRFDDQGTLEWTHDMGPELYDFALDETMNSYAAMDTYFRKYDAAGTLVWNLLLSYPDWTVHSRSVARDGSGHLYVTGWAEKRFGEQEGFLSRYADSGTRVWDRRIGPAQEWVVSAVRIDTAGNAYVVGAMKGTLEGNTSSGLKDVFVAKYDAEGTRLWLTQFGTGREDVGTGLALSGNGGVYITGYTAGSFDTSKPPLGDKDVFVSYLDAAGVRQWTLQAGTASDDEANAIVLSPEGRLFVTGSTRGRWAPDAAEGLLELGQAFLLEVTPQGELQRIRQFNLAEGSVGKALLFTPDGHLLLTGAVLQSWGKDKVPALLLLKF